MYKRILVPTDGSDVAEAAVDHAIAIATKYGAEIHALYVADTDAIAYSLGTEQVDRIRQGNFAEMTELREQAEGATGYVTDLAEEARLDVAEHHARSGVRRALLGSVTERTLHSTHVPVLIVDYRGAREE